MASQKGYVKSVVSYSGSVVNPQNLIGRGRTSEVWASTIGSLSYHSNSTVVYKIDVKGINTNSYLIGYSPTLKLCVNQNGNGRAEIFIRNNTTGVIDDIVTHKTSTVGEITIPYAKALPHWRDCANDDVELIITCFSTNSSNNAEVRLYGFDVQTNTSISNSPIRRMKLGNVMLPEFNIGNKSVNKVYMGDTQVYSKIRSDEDYYYP